MPMKRFGLTTVTVLTIMQPTAAMPAVWDPTANASRRPKTSETSETSKGSIFLLDYFDERKRLSGMKELGAAVFRLKELHPTISIAVFCDDTTRVLL